jgi:hypothetical protein
MGSLAIILLLFLALGALAGCAGTIPIGSAPTATPVPTVTPGPQGSGVVGPSSYPLPSDIPLPGLALQLSEYAGKLAGQTATVWIYGVAGPGATAASVLSFYRTQMPQDGWRQISLPGGTGGAQQGQSVVAFFQGTTLCAVGAGSDKRFPGVVALFITVAR